MSGAAFDIAIVGGGLVGASLACALAELDYSVVLLEAVPPGAAGQPSYDDRTLALNHASCQILRSLGLWSKLEGGVTPIEKIFVSERRRPGRVELSAQDCGLPAFGNVVEARTFGDAIQQHLPELESVTVLCPARVSGLSQDDKRVRLDYSTGEATGELTARLIVAADGARSTVRDLAGVEADVHDYRQNAVIANVSPEKAHANRAFEHFTHTGPLAVMPHVGARCGVIWCVERGAQESLLEAPDEHFLETLQQRFGRRLGRFLKVGRRSTYPLYQVIARQNMAGRVVIIGNAAHAIHPNSAQGFNLGLRDAAVLAELLEDSAGGDPGDSALLRQYVDWRQPDQQATIRYSDGLARLFSNPSLIAGIIRSAGMALHELVPPLKRHLAMGAMGFRGRVPRLAKGERISHGQ